MATDIEGTPPFPNVAATATVYGLVPLFCVTLLVLYGSSSGVTSWLVSKDTFTVPIDGIPVGVRIPGNGRLGLQTYCPNTGPNIYYKHWRETGEFLRSVPGGPCYQLGWDCMVTFCLYNETAEGVRSGECAQYDIFNPRPIASNDTEFDEAYNIISRFPGAGSCAAYNTVRWFHWSSFTLVVLLCFVGLQMLILYPLGVKDYLLALSKGISVLCFLCGVCSIITVSVFAGSIAGPSGRINTGGGFKDAGFWLEVSALILMFVFLPLPNVLSICELPETRIRVVSTDYEGPGNRTTINPNDPPVVYQPDEESPAQDAESLNKRIRNMQATIASKDRQIADLQEQLARGAAQAGPEAIERLAAREVEVAGLQGSLAEKEQQLAALKAELKGKDAELAGLAAQAAGDAASLPPQPLYSSPAEGAAKGGAPKV
eukprot:CAMPEP_0117649706 /NCGR_PEP_ID=MMETSP0804-20121206/1126_1 /TAXON_ID=1074897 /ORGANISM="Tetraselmis astigmatica, Strain CCMP880" /LENGTH=428 /DNA_ID=CAMNT_0005455483 /DNA_START=74 /DNA_END=1360 /DNA_ORIENTATION=-